MHKRTGKINKAGDSPLSLAYKGGHWEVVKYLAITHHCDTKSKTHFNSSLLTCWVNLLLNFGVNVLMGSGYTIA